MKAVAALPVEAPIRVRDDPTYRPHAERLSDLKDQLAGYDRQITLLERASNEPARKTIAEAIANGADVREIEPRNDNRALLRVAVEQRAAIEEATKIVEARARTALAEARGRFIDRARPEHVEITRAMAEALIAVGHAQELATAFGEKLRASGAGDWPAMFGPLGVCRVGVPSNQRSVFAAWLVGAVNAGAMDIDLIPSNWRAAWGQLADLDRAATDPDKLQGLTCTIRKQAGEVSAPPTRARAAAIKLGW